MLKKPSNTSIIITFAWAVICIIFGEKLSTILADHGHSISSLETLRYTFILFLAGWLSAALIYWMARKVLGVGKQKIPEIAEAETEVIQFPIHATCNKNAGRNVIITILGGMLIAIIEGLRLRHCHECSPLLSTFIEFISLAVPIFLAVWLIRDRPANITINPSSVEIQKINLFGFRSKKPFAVNISEFRYLTYKPVTGGPAVATPFSPFAVGGGTVIRLILRGKPNVDDVIFDLPKAVKPEYFSQDMPILRSYMRRLGHALGLRVQDEIWGTNGNE